MHKLFEAIEAMGHGHPTDEAGIEAKIMTTKMSEVTRNHVEIGLKAAAVASH